MIPTARQRYVSGLLVPAMQLGLFFLTGLQCVSACPACLGPGKPQLTLVQRMVDCDQIVVAKATKESRNQFMIENIIQGDTTIGARIEVSVDDLFVSDVSQSERLLLGRHKLGRRWKPLAAIDTVDEPWLRRLASLKRTSELSESDWVDRVRWFLPDLHQADPLIRATALGEIARAPYAAMRANRDAIDQGRLLSDWRSDSLPTEYRSLYVLLLGIGGDEVVGSMIDDQLMMLGRRGETLGLAAWLVAKLERTGPSGLAEIQRRYVDDGQRSEEERSAAVLAMSIHGGENPNDFREPVVAIYGAAIAAKRANLLIISDLTRWSRWELCESIRGLLAQPDLPVPVCRAIQSYLQAANA